MGDGEDEFSEIEMICEMPFVVCESHGGALDDESFVIGYELGAIAAEMFYLQCSPHGHKAIPAPRYVHTLGLKQLDLISMKHGYVFFAEEEEYEDWTLVTFDAAEIHS